MKKLMFSIVQNGIESKVIFENDTFKTIVDENCIFESQDYEEARAELFTRTLLSLRHSVIV